MIASMSRSNHMLMASEAPAPSAMHSTATAAISGWMWPGATDAAGFEPVKRDGKLVGFVTFGAYGHHVGQSLALAYVDKVLAGIDAALTVDVIGENRTAGILP